MTVHHQSQQDRIDSGLGFEWDTLPPCVSSLVDVDPELRSLRLRREKNSHRGVRHCRSLTSLWAKSVDQHFLDEITELANLEFLYLDRVTAKDLSGLAHLRKLKRLLIDSAPSLEQIDGIASLPDLCGLGVTNCKSLHDLEPISDCTTLTALGIEGGMWQPMEVHSLQPLSGLVNLSYVFLTNLRVTDGSLLPLASLSKLKVIQCANFFSRQEFLALSQALPHTRCDWFARGGA